jgi:hypothetical protein
MSPNYYFRLIGLTFIFGSVLIGCTNLEEQGIQPLLAEPGSTLRQSIEDENDVVDEQVYAEDGAYINDQDNIDGIQVYPEGGEIIAGQGPSEIDPDSIESFPEESEPIDWIVYRDEEFGFELRYPSVYVVLTPPDMDEIPGLELLEEVWFQDQVIAQKDTPFTEPANFAVRIYDNHALLTVDQWIDEHIESRFGSGWETKPYRTGVRICSQLLMAPNCFVYLTNGDFIYELVPVGMYSEEMLESFKFIE